MKYIFRRLFCMLLITGVLFQTAVAVNDSDKLPYSDVPQDKWSYLSIKKLYDLGVLPDRDLLGCDVTEQRGNFVVYLYSLANVLGAVEEYDSSLPFTDISENDPDYKAYVWAWKNDIIRGVDATTFQPSSYIKRQDACVIMIRFARYLDLQLSRQFEASQFKDSLRISQYARSPVTACQMIGLVNGYENGFFRPSGKITREECAAMICRLYDAIAASQTKGAPFVRMGEGAYDALYSTYSMFQSTLPQCPEVPASHFDDAVFVGDSVSVWLQYYGTATKALGNAKFLCAGSLSSTNALSPVTNDSVHPSYQGKKMTVEDGVAATGARKVYIMLGINNISYGLERSTGDMVTLINRILAKSPEVTIYIQSVTPMSPKSNILSKGLNNDTIIAYNERMQELCEENGWYFVNVAEVFRDDEGYLPAEYCSDYEGMGIHFNNAAAKNWVAYLKTHALTEK